MLGHLFYNDLIRKYVVLFGTLFNDIHIRRLVGEEEYQQLKVPLSYSPKEKFLVKTLGDPNLDRPFSLDLPRMGFEITGYKYAGDRKLLTVNRHTATSETGQTMYQYNPVPYDISFNLYIAVKNAQDGTRIVEQILPFFTPDWTVTAKLIPDLDLKLDIPIVLNSVTCDDAYENDFITRRAIVWVLSFTLKGYLFGPIITSSSTGGSLIKTIIINTYKAPCTQPIQNSIGEIDPAETITIIPVVNGKTLEEITASDDYGFSTTIT